MEEIIRDGALACYYYYVCARGGRTFTVGYT